MMINMSSSAQDSLYPTHFDGEHEKDLLWLWEKQELNTSYCDEDNSFPKCWDDNEYSWLDKQKVVIADTVQQVNEDVPKWFWDWKTSDNEDIDQTETMEDEIATQDIYGNWIPGPSDFKFNLESVPTDTNLRHQEMANINEVCSTNDIIPVETNNANQKVINSNEDKFSTWWALSRTRKDYSAMIPGSKLKYRLSYIADSWALMNMTEDWVKSGITQVILSTSQLIPSGLTAKN